MIYLLLGIFGHRRKFKEASVSVEAVADTICRLEVLADHLETTAEQLEELVHTLKEEEMHQ